MPTFPPQLAIEPLPGPFDVTIADLPGSKSLTNRALLLAALAEGTSTLTNVLFSDDTRVMTAALTNLGFKLEINEPARTVTVHGRGGVIPNKTADLHLGNAGTAMRFLTAACCLGAPGSVYTLDGVPRMRQRPIGELVEALRQLGATIEYLGEEGYPPLRIHACGLAGGELKMKPTLSSQFISALLQIGPHTTNGIRLIFKERPISFPYVLMTHRVLSSFGAKTDSIFEWNGFFQVHHGPLTARSFHIEPDASNASYFFAAAAIHHDSHCVIQSLHKGSVQGDVDFAEKLRQMGAEVEHHPQAIEVRGTDRLLGDSFDLNAMPDMAQTLAVVALFADGSTTIRNVGNLRVKETNRIEALEKELTKLGAKVTVRGDDITIEPPDGNVLRHRDGTPISREHPVHIDTYDDHRMAMSFAVAGLRSPGIVINDPGCVSKTFPGFFEYLERLRQ